MPENEKAATMCSCFSPPTKPFYIISLETKTKSEADFIQAELRLLNVSLKTPPESDSHRDTF